MTILHGDMRFYNNLFVQKEIRPDLQKIADTMRDSEWTDGNLTAGTVPYEGYPDWEQYQEEFSGYCGMAQRPATGIIIPCRSGRKEMFILTEPGQCHGKRRLW